MARLLALLLLYQQGYEVGRYVSLERIIEQSKQSYYDTLYQSSQGWHEGQHDVLPWTEYFLGTLLAAYDEFESRFGTISKGHGSKTDMIRNAVDGFIADFSITEVEKACPKAVSYTHLDVYKRQRVGCKLIANIKSATRSIKRRFSGR